MRAENSLSLGEVKGICGLVVLTGVALGDTRSLLHVCSTLVTSSPQHEKAGTAVSSNSWGVFQGFQRHYYYY